MRMISPARRLRSERGFSMFLVIMALFMLSMFVAAAFAAANGDLPLTGVSKDRKTAYAAAEAGLNYYATQVHEDPDYWTHCENVDPPNATEKNPVNTVWNGVGGDPRRWRNVTGAGAQYTIEILPANGAAACVDGKQSTVLDQKTGTFRIRVTGRASATSKVKRSLIATFKRQGFLDYLYYTNYEDLDPQALTTQTARDQADAYCAGLYRWERPRSTAPKSFGGCQEINWISGDGVAGPMHSNDSLLVCNSPTFGRDANDKVEVVPTVNARVPASGCVDKVNMLGQWRTGATKLLPPTNDQPLKAIAQNGGYLFSGRTIIYLNGANMTVTDASGTKTEAFPSNGVVYVQNSSTGTCNVQYPVAVDYTVDDSACGNVYVSGSYSSSLTIAADNDVIIAPTAGGALNWNSAAENITMQQGSDAVLGLIANRFVRVGHAVNRSTGVCNVASGFATANVEVDAAVLAIGHSWIVDNYDCGQAGKLTVSGAIAQTYRGPVGTGTHSTGFLKDYHYDDRLRYRSPPYFLSPIAAQWSVIRENEQVPAR
jgi:Tfp pilus assembly protein PilX